MFFQKKLKHNHGGAVKPKPKESKPCFSLITQSIMIPGAVIAAIFIFIATGFGIFRLLSFSKKKKENTKQTTLDT